jgi:hypothetical protein
MKILAPPRLRSGLTGYGYAAAIAGGVLALSTLSAPAQAQSSDSSTISGVAGAEVIEPSRLMRLRDLRFGAFAQPTAASSLTIAPNGTATAVGQIASTMTIQQPVSGRGQAIFRIDGTPNRAVVVQIPNRITISNGSATMQVNAITSNLPANGRPRMDPSGVFYLNIGGTLNVAANQAPGHYTGNFTVTVIFQ